MGLWVNFWVRRDFSLPPASRPGQVMVMMCVFVYVSSPMIHFWIMVKLLNGLMGELLNLDELFIMGKLFNYEWTHELLVNFYLSVKFWIMVELKFFGWTSELLVFFFSYDWTITLWVNFSFLGELLNHWWTFSLVFLKSCDFYFCSYVFCIYVFYFFCISVFL